MSNIKSIIKDSFCKIQNFIGIENSGVDSTFYLSVYPDVYASGIEPHKHYFQHGWREGRNPSPNFNTLYVKDKYGLSVDVNPLIYFKDVLSLTGAHSVPKDIEEFVEIQKNIVVDYFDEKFYRNTYNIDLDVDALEHYLTTGWLEGNDPSRLFSSKKYLNSYSYLRSTNINPLYHCVTLNLYGLDASAWTESDKLEAKIDEVDAHFYLLTYPDVYASGIDPRDHYFDHGWKEGRNPSSIFNTLYIKDKYNLPANVNPLIYFKDVLSLTDAHSVPKDIKEFVEIQKNIVVDYFDEKFYRNTYNIDLDVDALEHYLTTGWFKGNNPSRLFSSKKYLDIYGYLRSTNINPLYHCVTLNLYGLDGSAWIESEGLTDNIDLSASEAEYVSKIEKYFDRKHYVTLYKDVVASGMDPILHFIRFGWKENRLPSELFWPAYYRERYEDLSADVNPLYHYVTQGIKEGRRPNPVGFSKWPTPKKPEVSLWDSVLQANNIDGAKIRIIIPVYKGYDDTLAAIYAVLSNPQNTKFNLLVINDCSPDARITNLLRRLHEKNLFGYIENDQNLGFVSTVNLALKLESTQDVVLLNSDTVVFGNWLDRLVDHANSDPMIASITPFSNNATICSYPVANINNVISLEVSPLRLDQYSAICNKGRYIEIPTGVGFCFYMRNAVMKKIGLLDEDVFGRGYGEENDWCLRAFKAGYKNVLAQDIFVYHSGQVSFAEFANEEYSSGQSALSSKHPDYQSKIRQFIQSDHGKRGRMRLDLFRIAKVIGPRSIVFIVHSWGGGIETAIQDLIILLELEGIKVVVLRLSKNSNNFKIELPTGLEIYTPSLGELSVLKYADLITDFFGWLQPMHLHIHSFAGLNWRAVQALTDLIINLELPYYVTAHDFETICHRYNMVTPAGKFCGQPSIGICEKCVSSDESVIDVVSPVDRRFIFGEFLRGARAIFTPSDDTARRLTKEFPKCDFNVRPHPELSAFAPMKIPDLKGNRRIAIIGAIGDSKGVSVIHDLAVDSIARKLEIDYKIIGFSSIPSELMSKGVAQTGKYSGSIEAIQEIIDYEPHMVLLPSIWPETYCYVLSIAMVLTVPIACFNLGAQADRIRDLAHCVLIDTSLIDDPRGLNDLIIGLDLERLWSSRSSPKFHSYENILDDYYGNVVPENI